MGIEKKRYSFSFDEGVIEGLKCYAEKQNRSTSNFLEIILKKKLEQIQKAEKELSNNATKL